MACRDCAGTGWQACVRGYSCFTDPDQLVDYLGETTTAYHQVPRNQGAISTAYTTSPTPFTLARRHLFTTWPTTDPQIRDHRAWFTEFDARLDRLSDTGRPAPAHIYEAAVRALHHGFLRGRPADRRALDSLLPEPSRSRRRPAEVR